MNDKENISTSINRSEKLGQLVYTTKAQGLLDWMRRWGQKNQLWPFPVGTLCCGMEYHLTYTSDLGPQHLGDLPKQWPFEKSDLMIVVGTITENLLPYVLEVYQKMSTPKWVIAVGACAATGAPYPTYNVIAGIDKHIPVDVYVPGCPPSPDALLNAVKMVQERVEKGVCAAHGIRSMAAKTL